MNAINTIITIYQNPNNRGNGNNPTGFTKEFVINPGDTTTLANAVEYDNCPAKYANGYRKGSYFQKANCILADIDNAHSDNPVDWKTHKNVIATLSDVTFYHYPSRNNMKSKNGKLPRPKEHFLFPCDNITSVEEYVDLMKCLIQAFPDLHFDSQVKGGAQLNFGVEGAQVSYVCGKMNLSTFIKTIQSSNKNESNNDHANNSSNIIPEGHRNSTLCSYAARVLKRWGDIDDKAYQAFVIEAKKCSPPLDNKELCTIWNSALSFYKQTIQVDPDYTSPEQYNKTQSQNIWELPLIDPAAIATLCSNKPKKRKISIANVRLFLQAFGITVKANDMNRRTEIEGLPPNYSGEDDCNLLVILISDAAHQLMFKRASPSIIHDTLSVIANEHRYHPVIELLGAEPWDRTDRLQELYRILGIENDFHKILVKKWALQTVAVLYNSEATPIAAQGVLVLQGAQGIGKTEFFRHLAIKNQFFKGGTTLDMLNKDSLMSATKVWICELGEIDSTTKKAQSAVKAFLTEQTDRFREPYARCETVRPRRTSFCGTVNPQGYLRDETGNRRYWTIPIEKIDIEQIFAYPPEWYAQFWRQIHTEYIANPKGYLLTREEQDRVNERNIDFETELDGEDAFLTLFNTEADSSEWNWLTAAVIAEKLNSHFRGLNIRSESIGKLISRFEKRSGENLRKTVSGRKFIFCPPERKM